MTRTKILVALFAVIISAGVLVLKLKTKVDWDKLQSIEVYTDTSLGRNFEKMEEIELSGKVHHLLDLEKARPLLKRSRTKAQVVTIWKGYSYAVARFSEGKPLRMKVSGDGGFFFVLNFGRKYQIDDADMDAWGKLWAD